jgi:hypothetical protein
VLCVEGVMADCIAYVQLAIQSVPVDQPIDTKHVKLSPVLYVKLQTCVIRNTANLYYM